VGTVDKRVRRFSACKLDVGALLDTLQERMGDDWANIRLEVDPRSFVSDGWKPGVKMCRYKHWMGLPKLYDGYTSPAHHRALLRFRLCASDLAVNSDSTRSRGQRVCCACRINGAMRTSSISYWNARRSIRYDRICGVLVCQPVLASLKLCKLTTSAVYLLRSCSRCFVCGLNI
jgi:hypothetical protein